MGPVRPGAVAKRLRKHAATMIRKLHRTVVFVDHLIAFDKVNESGIEPKTTKPRWEESDEKQGKLPTFDLRENRNFVLGISRD